MTVRLPTERRLLLTQRPTGKLLLTDDTQSITEDGGPGGSTDGEMFFGEHGDIIAFYPENQQEQPFSSSVIVTDVNHFNQSWGNLPAKEQMEISELSPAFGMKYTGPLA